MGHVQDKAEESVCRVIDVRKDGEFAYPLDDGSVFRVGIAIDRTTRGRTVDFTGTSPQQPTNFHAPTAVCRAAVLYVFRPPADDHLTMNEGCLKPVRSVIAECSMIGPYSLQAVVGGNAQTTQGETPPTNRASRAQ